MYLVYDFNNKIIVFSNANVRVVTVGKNLISDRNFVKSSFSFATVRRVLVGVPAK